jgi:hypothetical protein
MLQTSLPTKPYVKRAFIIELSVEDFEALRRLKTIGL